jgi:hypothetical protein
MSSTVNIGTLEGLLRWKTDSTELDKSLDQAAKKANVSRAQLNAYNREIESVNQTYKKVAASIDPATAAEQKLEKAHTALSNALKIGLIDHQKYNALLDQAKQKYSETESPLKSLIESVVKLTGSLGPAGAGAHEVAEGLGGLAGKAGSLGEMIAGLGPLLPIVIALAGALAAVGVAFEAFEFIKDAIKEGLQLQTVIERLNDSLRNTGSYSGLSSHEIIELAGSYALLTGRTKEQVIQGALVLTHFRHLTEESYPRALDATLAYAKAMGVTADEAARKLGPILDGNTRSLRGLKEAGVDLTKGQLLTLNQLVETGHIVEYQNLLFDILREKVGLAAGAHETLGIQAGRVRYVFSELKEGIASELIPVLEYLSHDIFGSIDNWKQASKSASDFGHTIGDFLRDQIYGVIVIIHDVQAAVAQVFIWMDQAVVKVSLSLAELFSSLHLDSAAGAMLSVVSRANFAIANTTAEMYKNKKASDDAIDSWLRHTQALEGNTNANKNHGLAQDEIAAKTKAEKDLLDGLTDTLRKVEAAREAINVKSGQELSDGESLLSARLRGNDAYEAEKTRLEGLRKERELLAPLTKLEEELKAKLADTVKKLSDKYGENSDKIKEAKADVAGEIALIDATIESIKHHALEISIDTAVMNDWAKTQKLSSDAAHAWAEQVTKDFKIALDAKTELNNKLQEAFKIATINAPTIHLQNIEIGYLEFLKNLHGKTEEETQRLFANLAKLEGISVEQLTAEIKGLIGLVDDTKILASIKGASKTPYDIYKEERDNIVRVMEESTNNVALSVDQREQIVRDGNAALAQLDRERYAGILSNASGALDFLAQHFGSFFAQLKSLVDGIQQAQGFGSNVQGLVGSFTGGSGSYAAGAAGGVATVVGIFAVVYDFVDKMIKAHNALKMGTLSSLQVVGGDWSSPSYFDETGRKFDVALRNAIQSILDSIHGVLTDLPQITIRARADGKKFATYVAGVFVGEFDSAQEAMEQGIASALSGASFANLSAEMKRVLEASIGKTLTELEANIKTANEAIADRLGDLGNSFLENIDKYLQRIEAERKLGLSTEATTQAMMRSIEAYKNQILGIDTTASDRLAALRSLDLGMKEASGSIQVELQKRIDDVIAQIAALENQAKRPPGGAGSGGTGSGAGFGGTGFNELGGGPLPVEDEALRHLREVLRQYMDELNKIPKALTDQQISLGIFDTLYQYLQKSPKYAEEAAKWAKVKVEIEFAQIKLQLELLGKWEEFQGMFNDAYNAALAAAGKAPHAGSGKSNDKQSVQSFIDDRKFQLQLAQMDQFHQQLAQIAKDYEAQLKAAGKDKKLREELLALQAQETAAAIAAHKKDVGDRFNQLVSPNDIFAQAVKPFEDMKKEIVDAGFGAARTATMIGRLTAAEKEAIEKLSRQQFSSLVGDLSNIIADSKTNAAQHLLHNDLLRAQEIINYQIKIIELRNEYILLKAKGDLTKSEIDLLDKAFGWIDKNANILPGGKDWVPSFEAVTTAADSISSAAGNLNSASDELKTAIQSLTDYQNSLHTDSSLGLVNSREALDNSKLIYEAIAAKALTGDVSAIKEFKDDAENYRKNILTFSPSSALASNVLQGIDATIDKIKALPPVTAVLSPDGQAIVTNLGYVASGISSVNTIAQAINDNLKYQTPAAIADAMNTTMMPQAHEAVMAQNKNAEALLELSDQFRGMANNILAFRTEARTNSDDLYTQFKRAAETLDVVAANTRPRHQKAGVGG